MYDQIKRGEPQGMWITSPENKKTSIEHSHEQINLQKMKIYNMTKI